MEELILECQAEGRFFNLHYFPGKEGQKWRAIRNIHPEGCPTFEMETAWCACVPAEREECGYGDTAKEAVSNLLRKLKERGLV